MQSTQAALALFLVVRALCDHLRARWRACHLKGTPSLAKSALAYLEQGCSFTVVTVESMSNAQVVQPKGG